MQKEREEIAYENIEISMCVIFEVTCFKFSKIFRP